MEQTNNMSYNREKAIADFSAHESAFRASVAELRKTSAEERLPTAEELAATEEISEAELAAAEELEAEYDPDDSVKMYLHEIGRYALLTGEQEIALAKAILVGRETAAQLKELGEAGIDLPDTDMKEMNRLVSAGKRAADDMANANLRLVVSIAKKHVNRGLPLPDLIQNGNLGLMKAIEKFDYTKGYKLSTYATWWIRQAISRGISDQARTIRIPVHMTDTVNRLSAVALRLEQLYGYPPSDEEIAEEMGIHVEKVREFRSVAQVIASLNAPVGEDGDATIADFISDEGRSDPEEVVAQRLLKELIRETLSVLPERDRQIIELRFGLNGGEPHTLEQVGDRFGITRERVRQIEAKALRRLRHPGSSKKLRDFYLAA